MSEPLKPRVMGLDVGQVRVGIALSDPLHVTAQPHSVLTRKNLEADLQAIEQLVRQESIQTVVVGWPRTLRGKASESTRAAEAFAEALRRYLSADVTVELWDERLTTVQAEAALIEADVRRKKRKKTVDKIAAALILQNYLDCRRSR